jgi:hypothetical protein
VKKKTSSSSGAPKNRPKQAAKSKNAGEAEIRGDLEASRRYGVSTRTVKSWRDAGMPHRKEGQQCIYLPSETDPWVDLQRRPSETQNLSPATKLKLAREGERLKQDRLKAAAMERSEAVELGNVLPRDEWELFAVEVVQQARDRFMRLPKMLCKHVPAKYHRVLQAEGEGDVRKICAEMARCLEQGVKD